MLQRTNAEGMPSTRIIRRSFFVPSSVSPVARDFEAALGWLRSLLKEWAVAADIQGSHWQVLTNIIAARLQVTSMHSNRVHSSHCGMLMAMKFAASTLKCTSTTFSVIHLIHYPGHDGW